MKEMVQFIIGALVDWEYTNVTGFIPVDVEYFAQTLAEFKFPQQVGRLIKYAQRMMLFDTESRAASWLAEKMLAVYSENPYMYRIPLDKYMYATGASLEFSQEDSSIVFHAAWLDGSNENCISFCVHDEAKCGKEHELYGGFSTTPSEFWYEFSVCMSKYNNETSPRGVFSDGYEGTHLPNPQIDKIADIAAAENMPGDTTSEQLKEAIRLTLRCIICDTENLYYKEHLAGAIEDTKTLAKLLRWYRAFGDYQK